MPSEYATVEVRGDEAFERDQSLIPVSIYRTNTNVEETVRNGEGIETIGVEELPTTTNQQKQDVTQTTWQVPGRQAQGQLETEAINRELLMSPSFDKKGSMHDPVTNKLIDEHMNSTVHVIRNENMAMWETQNINKQELIIKSSIEDG